LSSEWRGKERKKECKWAKGEKKNPQETTPHLAKSDSVVVSAPAQVKVEEKTEQIQYIFVGFG
jgi:hypothetical protein